MGEGALPGGFFRQSAPGELEINIPGVVESPVNAIIRSAYSAAAKHKGESTRRTIDGKLYPRGFTPPQDYIVDFTYNRGAEDLSRGEELLLQDIPDELGVYPDLNSKKSRRQSQSYLKLQEAPLRFFDAPSVQFRHLLEYQDTTTKVNLQNPIVDGTDGNRPGLSYKFSEFNGSFIDPGEDGFTAKYLASFVRTHRENEDPTLLGFDFHIRLSNSPLFNGTLEKFLVDYGATNIELRNRVELLKEFQKQFLNFFKTYDPNHINENLPSVGQFSSYNANQESQESTGSNMAQTSGVSEKSGQITNKLMGGLDSSADMKETYLGSSAKAYYVQSISGLGKLNESNEYGEGGQRFVKWGADALTISVNEDVSQNMGYLASLYKNLAWSREKGRLVVPENLLRFEVVLDITEIRNYVRMYKNGKDSSDKFGSALLPSPNASWIEVADQTSKYRYFVHDCQFFFPGMPHGDTLTNSPQDTIKGLDFKIYFKHSNLRFMKFGAPMNVKTLNDDYTSYNARYKSNSLEDYDDYFRIKVVDNSTAYVGDVPGDINLRNGAPTTSRKTIWNDGNLEPTSKNTAPIGHPIEIFDDRLDAQKDNVNNDNLMDDLDRRSAINNQLNFNDKVKIGAKDVLKSIKRAALNTAATAINRQILSVASLVNRTLNQIYNSTPVVGGIKPPKNLYEKPDAYEQAYIDFVGPGLKTFFEDPMKFRKEGKAGETLEERIQRGRAENPNPRPGRNPKNYLELANAANETTSNRTLKQIVDSDPALGNAFSGMSKIPYLGNSAQQTTGNKTSQQKVNDDPNFGSDFAGDGSSNFFSFVPEQGNSADFHTGTPKTLKQIVDNDPALGNGSGISKIPFLGNRATSTNNNLTLQQKVDADPALGNGGNISNIPSLGNNAQQTNSNQTLQQIVDSDPALGNGGNISTDPALGNSGQVGDNLQNNVVVSQNSLVNNPSLGNSALIGNNTPNDSTVIQNTLVESPSEGNSALIGNNTPNDSTVIQNTLVENPSEGNSAITGANSPNDFIVLENTLVESPSEGNSALTGANIPNDLVVTQNTNVTNPDEGNSALTGANIPNDDLVTSKTKVTNPDEGNSALTGVNIPNDKLVSTKSKVTNPDSSNSAQFGVNQNVNDLISKSSQLSNKEQGNSAQSGINQKTDGLLESKSTVVNSEVGNSSQEGSNTTNNFTVESNSRVENTYLGNSALTGANLKQNEIIGNSSKLQNSGVGNSAQNAKNISNDDRISKNTSIEDAFEGNSGTLGKNNTTDTIIKNRTSLNEPELGNNGQIAANKTIEQKISNNSNLFESEIGNSAQSGKNKLSDEIVEKQSKVENPDQANSATFGKNKNLNDFMKYSNSKVYGSVDWNNIQFPRSGNRLP